MKTTCCGRLVGCVCRRAASAKAGAVNVSSPIHFISNYTTVDGVKTFFKFSKCNQDRCSFKCKRSGYILPSNHIKSHSTGRSFPICTDSNLNCHSSNIIYLVSCTVCGLQYVGETKRTFGERMKEHLAKIKKKVQNQLVYSHFQSDERHRRTAVEGAVRLQIIEKIKDDDLRPSDPGPSDLGPSVPGPSDLGPSDHRKDPARKRRRERELFWISKLRTMHPFGLNDQIQGYSYSTNMSSGDSKDYNHYKIENLVQRKHKKKNRHPKKKKMGNFSDEDFVRFYEELSEANRNRITTVEPLIASKQIKFLRKFKESIHFNRMEMGLRFLVGNRVDYFKKIKPRRLADRYNWGLELTHKIIDDINMNALLKDKDLRSLIPSEAKKTDICLVFKFGPTIARKTLNYNQVLKDTDDLTWEEIEALNCDCADSDMADPVHGHIISGNLELIKNEELRELLAHGTKFRELPLFDMDKIKAGIKSSVNSLVTGLAKKHKISPLRFAAWKGKFLKTIFEKLMAVSQSRNYQTPVLGKQQCKAELERLKSKFVITVVDKAAGNFSFTCKKMYLMRLAIELGLQNENPGNDTYLLTDYSESDICKKLTEDMVRFKVTPKERDQKIALLYFNPKFHKNPIKMRFIAGNVGTVTSDLDNQVAKILKMMKKHFFNLCRQTELSSGHKYCFDIENSMDLRNRLIEFRGNAKSISINDFSTLYTLFEHEHLMRNISWLVSKLSKNAGMRYVKVTYNSAYWVKDDSLGDSFSIEEVLEMVEFLISNSYIKAFGKIFRQVCGIIMGGKISGWLSDLSLMVDEYKFIDKQVKAGNLDLVRKFKGLCRYRDDCSAINIENFKEIAKDIYPASLELTQENTDLKKASVLDMNVYISDDDFETNVYCKTDDFPFNVISLPFLNSNISKSICYGVFYSQVLRYQRLCSKLSDFEIRVKLLAATLLERGYNIRFLQRKFLKVLDKYKEEFDRWLLPDDIENWSYYLIKGT